MRPSSPVKESTSRMLLVKVVLILFFGAVALRLVHIQVIDASRYQEIAKRQYESKVVLPAERGNIYDRSGKILVSNTMFVSFAADPQIVGPDGTVQRYLEDDE